MPVARRVFGKNHNITLGMRWIYAQAVIVTPGATLEDTREGVEMLEDTTRTMRRVFGSTHPDVVNIEAVLGSARKALATHPDGPHPA